MRNFAFYLAFGGAAFVYGLTFDAQAPAVEVQPRQLALPATPLAPAAPSTALSASSAAGSAGEPEVAFRVNEYGHATRKVIVKVD